MHYALCVIKGGPSIGTFLNNWGDRMAYCKASRGSHMNEIVPIKNVPIKKTEWHTVRPVEGAT